MKNNFVTQKLSDLTTFKIGGPAKYFSICASIEDLLEAVTWCKDNGQPWFILGNGSNILVSDDGFPGMVIRLGGDFKNVVFDDNIVGAGAGVLLPALSRHFLAKVWGGFEFMCGIPGTVGGAVRINAGTKHGEMKDNLISVTILSPTGEIKTFSKDEMEFDYRHSRLADTRDIIISATFSKPYDLEKASIEKKIKIWFGFCYIGWFIKSRRDKQPKNHRNCGSVFKNPPGDKSAGWYIDQAGLKGTIISGAMVAHEHANWIVNLGHAKAEHVKTLTSKIQDEVFRKFGVSLEREVIYIPEDILGD